MPGVEGPLRGLTQPFGEALLAALGTCLPMPSPQGLPTTLCAMGSHIEQHMVPTLFLTKLKLPS